MLKRLWILVVVALLLLAGCAKPPNAALNAAHRQLARASAFGAQRFAPEPYRLAGQVLQQAEALVQQGEYVEAEQLLGQVRERINDALRLTEQRKQQQAQEAERLRLEAEAALKAAEAEEAAARQALLEQKRQQQLARQRAKKKTPAVKPVSRKAPAEPVLVSHVTVAPAENLQMIAARPEVYNDGQLWPLIYRANRDQIKDPKKISAGQVLLVPRDKSTEEIAAARQEAQELKLF